MITYHVEPTETYAGEANYSWVRRATFQAPANASRRTLMHCARRALDLVGIRGRVHANGDGLEFHPYSWSAVLFITPEY